MVDFYGTAAGFRVYHEARNNDVATFNDDSDVEASLLVASEWLDGKYRLSFGGLKVGQRAQIREWPRSSAFDSDGYPIASNVPPTEMENATYEAALRQLNSPGSLTVDWTPNKYKRASVDGAVSVEYAQFGSASDVQSQFMVIDQILAPILTGGVGGGNLSSLSGEMVRV